MTQGTLLIPYGERSLKERLAAKEPLGQWDKNVYWHTGGADRLQFYRRSFADWQALGLDGNSRIADPQFADADAHDFRLQPGSPALELGFQPLDISTVGLYGDPAWANEVRHADCPCRPLPPAPPPPAPLSVNDDFENTPVGNPPARARQRRGKRGVDPSQRRAGGERPAESEGDGCGRHTAVLATALLLRAAHDEGVVRHGFDVWMGPAAQFFTEWRDAGEYPQNVGPSVRFDGSGKVSVAGKVLAQMPAQTWFRVEIEATLGKAAPRTFQVKLTPAGGATQTFAGLPISGTEFHELVWLGYSSTAAADTVFYLDNVTFPR